MAIIAFKGNAKSSLGMSAKNIKEMGPEITPCLAKVLTSVIDREIQFPINWLESEIFFVCKGEGSTDKPENYRSIAIQNAILKTFM